MTNLDSPLEIARTWMADGHRVALATVVETWGSAPRPVGSHLAINDKGVFAGSVSGGCIENFLVSESIDVIDDGAPQVFQYGVTDEQAREVKLSCGGTIRVFVERLDDPAVLDALIDGCPIARVIDLASGNAATVTDGGVQGVLSLDDETIHDARRKLVQDVSAMVSHDGRELMVVAYTPTKRLIVTGAVHIAQSLAPMATAAGFRMTVIDPRPAFTRPGRMGDVDLITEPPEKAMADLALDANTAVAVLAHDPLLDDPALKVALASPVYYIGCLGSTRTHAKRKDRLRTAGFSEADLARLKGPIGLDLGGRATGEIAVSILAEVIAARYGKTLTSES